MAINIWYSFIGLFGLIVLLSLTWAFWYIIWEDKTSVPVIMIVFNVSIAVLILIKILIIFCNQPKEKKDPIEIYQESGYESTIFEQRNTEFVI